MLSALVRKKDSHARRFFDQNFDQSAFRMIVRRVNDRLAGARVLREEALTRDDASLVGTATNYRLAMFLTPALRSHTRVEDVGQRIAPA